MRRLFSLVTLTAGIVVAGCSGGSGGTNPGSSGGSSGGSGGGSSGGGGASSGGAGPECTVTFGGDAASVTSTECDFLGGLDGDTSVTFDFNGSATGLGDVGGYDFDLKLPAPFQAKTYKLTDLYEVADTLSVASTGDIYSVDYNSTDPSSEQNGSVTAVFQSEDHGTVDITLVSTSGGQATVHIEF
jgi:hypothetical protein